MKQIFLFIIFQIFIMGCTVDIQDPDIDIKDQEESFSSPSCPRGILNESYPGSCGFYMDKDNDRICDLSE